jgi:hypothetical protein
MVQTFYKRTGCNISFCTADYYHDKELSCHSLQINKGDVGQLYRFELLMTDNCDQIEEEFNSIRLEYPNRQPETIKIKVIIDLKRYLSTLPNKRINELISHLWNSAKYIVTFTGQGNFNIPKPKWKWKYVNETYEMAIEIIEKDSFLTQYFVFLSPSGITLDEIKIEEL